MSPSSRVPTPEVPILSQPDGVTVYSPTWWEAGTPAWWSAAKVQACSAPPALLTLQPALPDVEGCIEDIGFLQLVQLHLGVAHLVFHALQLIVQLQLLSLEFTVLPLVPASSKGAAEGCWFRTEISLSPPGLTVQSGGYGET